MQNTRIEENEMGEKKRKWYGKDPKISIWNWKLSLSFGSKSLLLFLPFFHSLHSAVHSFIRSHVFCEFSCFQNAIDFFSFACSLCFIRSFSTFSIRFHSLLYLVVQPFHPFHFDDRVAKNVQLQLSPYYIRFLPQFVSVFNFEFAKCIRFQSILSSDPR